ncbi:Pentatricopeptide repeat [Dillenia turbinata]|uniref:Pentatricopeptide repeat n=1 Tax=Dillenia turbinata TaxID=194707 RepID=A0AAN8ZHN5_9MAGN
MSVSSLLNRLLQRDSRNLNIKTLPAKTKSLTDTILSLLSSNRLKKAVSILFSSTEPVPFSLYARLFHVCSLNGAIIEARKLESTLARHFEEPPVFLLNRAIETYGKCGCVRDAKELFDEMPKRDGGSWNAMITAYAQNGCEEMALWLFGLMHRLGTFAANEVTLAGVLGSCAKVLDLFVAREIHGLIVKCGFCGNVILESALVDVYGKCGVMSDARRMFDEIERPNAVSWNVIVRRYLDMGEEKKALVMFFSMLRECAISPMNFTFSNALVACSNIFALNEGTQIHGIALKIGFEGDDVVLTSLIDMYVKCGCLDDACKIFEKSESRNLISGTTMVSGYAMSGRIREARELFDEMQERSLISWNAMLAGYINFMQWEEALDFVMLMRKMSSKMDHVTIGLVLNLCAGLSDIELGKQVHGYIYRHGYYYSRTVCNSVLDMYGKCGNLRSSKKSFFQMGDLRDSVSWNSLISTYVRHQLSEVAMDIFSEMLWEARPSKFTFGTMLAACANIFALEQGKQIHAFMLRNNYELDVVIKGGFVDMYTKCRNLDYALKVFKDSGSRDVIIWNSILLGCCHNGRGDEALELFALMEKEEIAPDHVTFQGILLACICEGHVTLGRQYFDSMSSKYHVIPRLEHYDFIIELYIRNGCIDALENFVKAMPFEPTVPMLTRVFNACREHGHTRLGKWSAERLNKTEPSDPFRFEIIDKYKLRLGS